MDPLSQLSPYNPNPNPVSLTTNFTPTYKSLISTEMSEWPLLDITLGREGGQESVYVSPSILVPKFWRSLHSNSLADMLPVHCKLLHTRVW